MTLKEKKLDATTQVIPSKVKFFDTSVGKTVKTLLFLAASAFLTAIQKQLATDPTFLGTYTDIALIIINNLVLVLGKNIVDPSVKNI